MHGLIRHFAAGCLVFSFVAVAPAFAPTRAEVDPIAVAIRQLGDPMHKVREKASHYLWSVGSAAEPALHKAAQSNDPEIAIRAREILADFRFGIRPDAPAQVVELARAYRRGAAQEKRSIVSKLFQIGPTAYPTLVRIRGAEVDPALRALIANGLASRALDAAHAFVLDGDYDTAEQFLDIALTDASDAAARAHAVYHLLRGQIDGRIAHFRAALEARHRPNDAKILTHLYRAKGDLLKARWAAEQSNDSGLLDNILFELGDWKALAARTRPADATDLEQLSILATYQQLAGDKAGFERSLDSLRRFADDFRGAHLYVAKVLLLNDRIDEAIALHRKHDQPQRAFELLCAQQKFKEAFALADQAKQADHRESPAIQCLMAKALHYLGEKQRALEIFDQQAAILSKESAPAMHRVLIEAEFQCGLVDRAFAHCAKALASGFSTSDRLLSALFPQQAGEAGLAWAFMRKRYPGDEPAKTLSRVRALLEGKCSPDELKALAADAAPIAMRMNSPQRSQFLSLLTKAMVAADQEELARSLLLRIGDATAYTELGYLAAGKKQWAAAADFYGRAMEKNRMDVVPRYLRGWSLLQTGQAEEGRRLMFQARLQPLARQQQRRELMEALYKAGLVEEARAQNELIIRTGGFASKEIGDSLMRAAAQARDRGDFLVAASCWQRSMQDCLDPDVNFVRQELYLTIPHMIHKLRAIGLIRAGQIDQALNEIDTCMALFPGDITLAIDLLPELEKAGRQREADALLARSLAHQEQLCGDYPGSAMLHNNAAWLLARCRRNLEQALAHASKAVELEPHNAAYVDTLAEVHFQRGEKARAIELLNRCIELEPDVKRHRLALKRVQDSSPLSDPIE